MDHSDEVHDDVQARDTQDVQEVLVRKPLVGRVYNAKGELKVIIDPGDEPISHIGSDGFPCYCDRGVNHRDREKPINSEKTD